MSKSAAIGHGAQEAIAGLGNLYTDEICFQAGIVYVYFDNDVDGHAPREAARLAELVGRA